MYPGTGSRVWSTLCTCFFMAMRKVMFKHWSWGVPLFFKIQAVGASYVRNLIFMHAWHSLCLTFRSKRVHARCFLKAFLQKLAGFHRCSLLFIFFGALLSGLQGGRDGQGALIWYDKYVKSQQEGTNRRVRPRQLSAPTNFHRAAAMEADQAPEFLEIIWGNALLALTFPPSWFMISFGCNNVRKTVIASDLGRSQAP